MVDLSAGMSTSFDIAWDPDTPQTQDNAIVATLTVSGGDERRVVTVRGEAL